VRESASAICAARVHVSGILVLYLLISCWSLREPGLEYDEVLFANAALGNIDKSFVAFELDAGGLRVPLMLMTYIGALKAYIYALILALFPVSPITVRLPVIIIGMITLVVTYCLLIRLVERRVALSVAWILATDPSFVFHTRIDFGPTVLMMFLKMSSLLAVVSFVTTGRTSWLALGSFLLGLGVFDKANFLWYVAGLLVATLVVWRKQAPTYLTASHLAVCGFFMVLGALPLVYYNLATGGKTFQARILLPENFQESMKTRTGVLIETLAGSGVYKYVNGLKPSSGIEALTSVWPSSITPWLILGALLLFCVRRWSRPIKLADPLAAFFALLCVLIVVQIYLTGLPVGWHHFMIVSPFHHIALCIFLFGSKDCCSQLNSTAPKGAKSRKNVPAIVLVTMMIASNLIVDAIYLKSFSFEGGRGFFSDAIYELAEYARQNRDRHFLLMDWGFSTQLLLLSRGSVNKEELFAQLETNDSDELLKGLYERAVQPHNLFVFHVSPYIVYKKPQELFEKMLKRFGLRSEIVKVFLHKRGDPVFFVVRAVV
jgi:4-amino-4-deoxy-L-arabinose transferase-like glycosyltransferase